MSRNNVLSPVKILDSKVLGVEFKTIDEEKEKSEPEDLLATKYGRGRSFIENECLRCEVILEAALDRVRKKSNVPIHFVASAKVGVTIAIPLKAIGDLSEARCLEYARANGISIAYGKIRSIIESITAETLVGKQTIPPIDPYALLERDSTNEDQDS